jgi:hypothetical protein
LAADRERARATLIAVLQHAYSGELAAAFADRGHWKSSRDPSERARIRQIEAEEWRHGELVGGMVAALGSGPVRSREVRAWLIGRTLGLLCHVSSWLAPMYGAGRLESRNIRECEAAARHARDCGRGAFVDCLLSMAEVEWERELYFRSKVASHPWSRWTRIWPPSPATDTIRASFAHDAEAASAVAAGEVELFAAGGSSAHA